MTTPTKTKIDKEAFLRYKEALFVCEWAWTCWSYKIASLSYNKLYSSIKVFAVDGGLYFWAK